MNSESEIPSPARKRRKNRSSSILENADKQEKKEESLSFTFGIDDYQLKYAFINFSVNLIGAAVRKYGRKLIFEECNGFVL